MNAKQRRLVKRHAALPWPGWLSGLSLIIVAVALITASGSRAAEIVVYKRASCGCCNKWIDHLERAGFAVEARDRNDLAPIKAASGVPQHLQSCHTARVGDYVIEGHVPADLVQRLLVEKPDIRGLAVPGMPMGSPGMEGPYKEAYKVLAIGHEAGVSTFAQR